MTRSKPLRHLTSGLLLAALALTLAACNRAGDPATSSLEQSIAAPGAPAGQSQMVALAPAGSSARALSQAVATLPGEAGAVATVRAKNYINGFRQDIALKGSPTKSVANGIAVLVRTSSQTTLDEAVPLYKPSETLVRSELGAQFPHIPMQVIERPSSNDYGPYGLALGRTAGNVHCLYMWQWIDENRLPRESKLKGPVSLRVRLCQADTNFDAMAAMVGHITIGMPTGDAVASDESARVIVASADEEPKPAPRKVKHAHRAKRATVARRDPPIESAAYVAPPQAAYQPAPLAGDLPPQALLGPKAAAAAKLN